MLWIQCVLVPLARRLKLFRFLSLGIWLLRDHINMSTSPVSKMDVGKAVLGSYSRGLMMFFM
ncbi:unnamed protein product [Brassica rapa]|uniref:Uncharacterized protein n=1 Tax=Brassica campestris TaxID=3711 RepID=A0A8D9GZQ0_BRACM|nr:unnamed protein product [Brassica rapa]